MTEKQIKRIHLIYGIVISVLIIATSIWAISSCYMLNKADAFTPDKILTQVIYFAIPFSVCVATIIIGIVLHAVFHVDEEQPKAFVPTKSLLNKLYTNLDLSGAPDNLVKVIKSQRGFRHTFFVVMIVNIVVNAISGLVYLFTEQTMAQRLSSIVIGSESGQFWKFAGAELLFKDGFPIICTTLSYILVPFFVAIVYDVFAKFTYEKELEAVKAIYAYYAKNGAPVSVISDEEEEIKTSKAENPFWFDIKNNWVNILKYTILVLSILLIVIGITNGLLFESTSGAAGQTITSILSNAKKMCLGCMGFEITAD